MLYLWYALTTKQWTSRTGLFWDMNIYSWHRGEKYKNLMLILKFFRLYNPYVITKNLPFRQLVKFKRLIFQNHTSSGTAYDLIHTQFVIPLGVGGVLTWFYIKVEVCLLQWHQKLILSRMSCLHSSHLQTKIKLSL